MAAGPHSCQQLLRSLGLQVAIEIYDNESEQTCSWTAGFTGFFLN